MSQEFGSGLVDLVKQKIFYHYEYMSNFEKFKEKLPDKKKFYGSLSGRGISDKKYQHPLKVWNKSELKTMKHFHNLYLNCDVLLLAEMFKKFRNRWLESYGLCPSYYLRQPAFV